MRPRWRRRGFVLATISTSWPSLVRRRIRRSLERVALVFGAGVDVPLKCLIEMAGHLRRAGRPHQFERFRAAEHPTCESQIGQAHDVVRVQVGEEHRIEVRY